MIAGAQDMAPNMLDLSPSVQHLVLELLEAKDLCLLGATCTALHARCMGDAALWRAQCDKLLGPATAALHSAVAPAAAPSHAAATGSGSKAPQLAPISEVAVRSSSGGDGSLEAISDEARYWSRLWRAADAMDGGGHFLAGASARFAASAPQELLSKLPRAGHTATPVGRKLVIAGGILQEGSLTMDVLTIDPALLSISRPVELGVAPETRFRHTAAVAKFPRGSALHAAAGAALAGLGVRQPPESGTLILLFGGYNTMGKEFGGPEMQALWVADGAESVAWLPLTTGGDAPARRFHHTADAFDGGASMVVFGGEGRDCKDGGEGGPAGFVLDVPSLMWRRVVTSAESPDACPGACALHLSTVRLCPETNHEELVVIMGSNPTVSGSAGGMLPYALDLTTFAWRDGPWRRLAAHVLVPGARQRPGSTRVAGKWLLMSEGSPLPIGVGTLMEDVHRLHLPSLTWRGPLPLHPDSGAVRRTAGHSATGLVMFGGIVATAAGIVPIARHDVLLLGSPGVPLKAAAPPAAAKAAPAAAAKPPVAGGDAVKTQPRSQLVAPTLSPDAAAGLREALGQVLWACGSLRSDGASSCAGPEGRKATAPLVVAGVLAAYAAHINLAEELLCDGSAAGGAGAGFTPTWPAAFPEHLRGGPGVMDDQKLPELATPAPNAALSLAWFQGVRAGSAAGGAAPPPPPRELQAAQEDDSGMLFSETAAGGIAPSASPQPAAAAAAEAALVGKRHTADFAAATPRAAARVAAVAKPNASGVTVAQSRGAAAQAAAASPVLGLPPLEAVVAKRSAVTAAAAGPAAPDVAAAAAAPAADAASAAAAVPRALAQQQPQQPASPAITKVPQLGRQLQQLTVTGQPPPLPPLAAAAAALPSPPHQQEYAHSRPPSLREHHTYSRQSSCGSWQAASMSPKVSALPSPLTAARPPPPPPPYPRPAEAQHRLPPMPPPPPPLAAYQYLHRALPPEGAEEFHRMVALQASLARWQHPAATAGLGGDPAVAGVAWPQAGYPMPAAMYPTGSRPSQPAVAGVYPPVRAHPPTAAAGWLMVPSAHVPPQPPAAMPVPMPQSPRGWGASNAAAWAHYWQLAGASPVAPPPPAQHAAAMLPGTAPPPPPTAPGQAVSWQHVGQRKGPPPPPPPRQPPPPPQQRQQSPGGDGEEQAVDEDRAPMLPVRSGPPRRSRGGQRRRKAAAAQQAAAAAAAASAGDAGQALPPSQPQHSGSNSS